MIKGTSIWSAKSELNCLEYLKRIVTLQKMANFVADNFRHFKSLFKIRIFQTIWYFLCDTLVFLVSLWHENEVTKTQRH